MVLNLITGPASEPVTLTEAKAQCRVDGTDEDTLVTALIKAARETVEYRLGLALITQTWELVLDEWWEDEATLPHPPLQTVTSITYKTLSGVTKTMSASDYILATGVPGRVLLADGVRFPSDALYPAEAIKIRYVAGWTEAASVPESIKLAIKLLVGHYYENREQVTIGAGLTMSVLPFGVDALLDRYREWSEL